MSRYLAHPPLAKRKEKKITVKSRYYSYQNIGSRMQSLGKGVYTELFKPYPGDILALTSPKS